MMLAHLHGFGSGHLTVLLIYHWPHCGYRAFGSHPLVQGL